MDAMFLLCMLRIEIIATREERTLHKSTYSARMVRLDKLLTPGYESFPP